MNRFYIISTAIVIFYNNFFDCGKGNVGVRGIMISYDVPLVDRDGSLIEYKNYFKVYYYRDLIMYEFQNGFDSSYNNKLVLEEYRKSYFVFHDSSQYGYNYDPFNRRRDNLLLSVDSILRKRGFKGSKWDQLLNFQIASSSFDKKSGVLEEKYFSKTMENSDTAYLFFSKNLSDISYSFSEKLDSLKKMKLFKIQLYYPERYNEEFKIKFPQRTITIGLQKISVNNSNEIISIFERFQKDEFSKRK